MAEATGLFLADIEENDLAEFDSITQEGSNTFVASASAALHGSYGARATFDGTNNDAYGVKSITARTEMWARCYFRLSADFDGNTGYLYPLVIKSGTTNYIYPRFIVTAGAVSISRFYHYADSGAVYAAVSQAVSKNVTHYIEVYFKAASAPGANDGIARLYFDETLISEVTGVDSDTRTVDGIYTGQRGTIIPTSGSIIDIDDVKMDSAYIGEYTDAGSIIGAGNIASAEAFGSPAISATISTQGIASSEAFGSPVVGDQGIVGAGGIASAEAFGGVVLSAGISASGIASAEDFGSPIVGTPESVIIDHASVAKYADIPQAYIDAVKAMWFDLPGESHSAAYRYGLQYVEDLDAKFAVNILESGTPEGPTSSYLRASCATWGDWDTATGWLYSYGEEDWYTSDAARVATKRHIQYCYDNTFGLSAVGFGWCWDMSWINDVTAEKDAVHKCGWAGSSVNGPEGSLSWGLDADDSAITGNSVCLDTYLAATQEYIDYCETNGIPTNVFFTTGPVDGYEGTGERGYQRHLKQERIRAYVAANGGYLFDYADILAWDNAGTENLPSWVDGDSGSHPYQMIADDNLLDFDGGQTEAYGHIGQRGCLRLGKATWVMLAMMAGWDGEPEGGIVGAGNITSAEAFGAAAISATITATSIESAESFGQPTIGGIQGAGGIESSEAFGAPGISATITATGIASSEAFGGPTVGDYVPTEAPVYRNSDVPQISRNADVLINRNAMGV
jgi:hypothetical protein